MDELFSIADDIQKKIETLPGYVIEIGVFSVKAKRKQKKTVRVGVTNAELMYIHENGSPLQNIPARPVLDMTIRYANENLLPRALDKCIEEYIKDFDESVIEKELNKLCMRMENYARHIIYDNDGRLAPNSPRVAAAKGGNHPLFNTGQLARSITCRLVKI